MSAEQKDTKPSTKPKSLAEAYMRIKELEKGFDSANKRAEDMAAALEAANERAVNAENALTAAKGTSQQATSIEEALAAANQRADKAIERADKEEAALIEMEQRAEKAEAAFAKAEERARTWHAAYVTLSEQHAKILQDKDEKFWEVNATLLSMRTGRDKEVVELKSRLTLCDEEISKMSMEIFQLRRDKQLADRQVSQAKNQNTILSNCLESTRKGVEKPPRKRAHGDIDDTEPTVSTAVATDMVDESPVTKKAKCMLPDKVVPCTQCFTKGWPCDNGQGGSCRNCQLRGKAAVCKRVMCKNWGRNTCKNVDCTFAHDGDGFYHVINYTVLKVKPAGLSPVQREDQGLGKKK